MSHNGDSSDSDGIMEEEVHREVKSKLSMREQHHRVIINVLSMERPVITPEMVHYLSQDEACAIFIGFITRLSGSKFNDNPIHNGPAENIPTSNGNKNRDVEEVSPDLVRSYRATMLLTNDDSTEALMLFLGTKSKLITKCIFPIFQNNSVGNLRHGCRIIDHLLRFRLDDVYEVLGKDADTVKRYVGLMMNYIDHAPVADVLLNLVCKPHNPALIRHYSCSPQRKWAFFRALSEWKFLLVLGQRVCSDDHSESQTIAAAEVFCELLDRLAADENGEILLQPAAYCPELLEGFVRIAVDRKVPHTNAQRTAAMKCVLRLLQKSVIEKVQGPPTSPYQSFGATIVNLVPNQLASLRERIYALVENHMEDFLKYLLEKYQDQQNILMNLDSGAPLPETAVKHTSYVCKAPFTELRLTLVLTLVEIASQNPAKLEQHFTTSVWRVLLSWFFEYAQNNLYHAAFYQLVFIAIRSDNKSILEVLIKKLKIITTLIEHYRNDEGSSNKGYILQICNAIRLQASSQSPDSFLRNFLQSQYKCCMFEWIGFCCTTYYTFWYPKGYMAND
jgi:hypothetical protein